MSVACEPGAQCRVIVHALKSVATKNGVKGSDKIAGKDTKNTLKKIKAFLVLPEKLLSLRSDLDLKLDQERGRQTREYEVANHVDERRRRTNCMQLLKQLMASPWWFLCQGRSTGVGDCSGVKRIYVYQSQC